MNRRLKYYRKVPLPSTQYPYYFKRVIHLTLSPVKLQTEIWQFETDPSLVHSLYVDSYLYQTDKWYYQFGTRLQPNPLLICHYTKLYDTTTVEDKDVSLYTQGSGSRSYQSMHEYYTNFDIADDATGANIPKTPQSDIEYIYSCRLRQFDTSPKRASLRYFDGSTIV